MFSINTFEMTEKEKVGYRKQAKRFETVDLLNELLELGIEIGIFSSNNKNHFRCNMRKVATIIKSELETRIK